MKKLQLVFAMMLLFSTSFAQWTYTCTVSGPNGTVKVSDTNKGEACKAAWRAYNSIQ
ncbi:hypothetical protein MCERE19_00199 [Spirosomataceae bacterium]|jgi:hypothetical protein